LTSLYSTDSHDANDFKIALNSFHGSKIDSSIGFGFSVKYQGCHGLSIFA
jgi:hypothetical protein